jgi:hypothetical protein
MSFEAAGNVYAATLGGLDPPDAEVRKRLQISR